MDYKEFSSKVKSKYPGVYDDLDDETLARKMVAKFPQYSDVSFDGGGSQRLEQTKRDPKEVSFSEIGSALKTGTLGKERVAELGGPMKAAYKAASAPSRELTKGLKAIVAKIPDPETRSAAANFALGIPETLGEIGAEMGGGAISPESLLLMSLPAGAISGPLGAGAKRLKEVARKRLPRLAQALTGVQKKYFARVFERPRLALPIGSGTKSLDDAGAAVEAAERRSFGEAAAPTIEEINDPAATTARDMAVSAARKLKEIRELAAKDPSAARAALADPETGALLLRGKRGTQFQLDQPSTRGSRVAHLANQKEEFVNALEENFPDIAPSLRDYAASITNEQATKLLPVLKSGDPSIARLVLTAIGRTVGAPFGISVPQVNSAAIALSRLGLNQLENIAAKSPQLKNLAVAEIARRKGASIE